ncbi:hypothetical protein F5ESL0236_00805 [Lactobacillus sp. ESL0236]|uniref:hypothetical protein n=1 Tax=Lactobacillus sp. ESL0234 TaxID=2069355 RepID=UPI000EFC01EF|nr:hypothetical protein [Lactobacillus sp. ESL0234]RMC42024.1 hypothetical protein F5ESL0237_00800 [Lactobacillus sp. ESL0237]RMC45631.1 hypothetical protein F5ESL0234_00800 [Lactobacillus sp. ESL0234]RMC47018.1 hypothetical protein F5ESL0236_00805 [Lactobacillus sp. ESL0236]
MRVLQFYFAFGQLFMLHDWLRLVVITGTVAKATAVKLSYCFILFKKVRTKNEPKAERQI